MANPPWPGARCATVQMMIFIIIIIPTGWAQSALSPGTWWKAAGCGFSLFAFCSSLIYLSCRIDFVCTSAGLSSAHFHPKVSHEFMLNYGETNREVGAGGGGSAVSSLGLWRWSAAHRFHFSGCCTSAIVLLPDFVHFSTQTSQFFASSTQSVLFCVYYGNFSSVVWRNLIIQSCSSVNLHLVWKVLVTH